MKRPVLLGFLALCWSFFSLLPTALRAENVEASGLRALVTMDEARGWEAVGVLELGNGRFCTATLIQENLLLSAAHCLFDPKTGALVPFADMRFSAGKRSGRVSATRGIHRAAIHPQFQLVADVGEERDLSVAAHDLALLELDMSIRKNSVHPFQVLNMSENTRSVAVLSYAQARVNRPSLENSCPLIKRFGNVVALGCSIDFGSSGSPVFEWREGAFRLVAMIVAKANIGKKPGAVGVMLEGGVDALRFALSSGQGRVFAVSGAKFMRP